MTANEGAGTTSPGTTLWQDMLFLEELRDEIGRPSAPNRDGADLIDMGFKPRPPDDPRWLKLLTWLMCVMAAVSLFVILYYRIGV